MILKRLLYPPNLKRFLFFLFSDILIISFSLFITLQIRFEFLVPDDYWKLFIQSLHYFITIKIFFFALFKMYNLAWRYVGLKDMINIFLGVWISELIIMALILNIIPIVILFQVNYPRSVFLIDGLITQFGVSTLRISRRVFLEIFNRKKSNQSKKRTIIVGAGNAGEMILRDIIKVAYGNYYPVALLDDDKNKIGTYIHGIKVVGSIDSLPKVISKYKATTVIIAIPSLSHTILKRIYNLAKSSGINEIKVIPRIYDVKKPEINVRSLEDIKIEDLIGRQILKIDLEEIENFFQNKTILITGAGGSIGSEIVSQLSKFSPKHLILLDNDETELHRMQLLLENLGNVHNEQFCPKFSYIVCDIIDVEKLDSIFEFYKPEIVFHAAAYKHVPMMELNADEAVKVNIFGTYNLVRISTLYKVKRFIMISTDKVVKPTSVMGSSKRIAEYICRAFNNENTEFISVRFGNVLGSRGSVLPIFLEQLKKGGPLTVTHKDMKRYFMTISEAVILVLQASVIGKGGEILVLDMGEPIYITKLAEELINLHGLKPYEDIEIKFIGIRPGENLFEEILTSEEGTVATKHEKIFVSKGVENFTKQEIENMLKEFKDAISLKSNDEKNLQIRNLFKKFIKHYEGENTNLQT